MKRKKKSSPGKDIISIRFLSVVLMSFVLILALLGLLYHQFQKAFLSSINRANEEFVYQVSATSSSTEEFLQNMVNQIFYSNTVSKLRSYEELTNWQVVDGVRELNTYSASSTIIDSIYIFNGKQQRVYSTSSYGAVGDSFSAFADRDAVALFENRSEAGRLVPILRHSDVSNIYSNRELYSFLFFELDRSGLPKDNAIMFNISKNWLNRLYFGGEDAFIIKEDGVLVASSAQEGEELYPLLTEKILSRTGEGVDSGYFIYQAQGRQICFFSRMPDRPWYYVKSLPYDQCLEDLRHTEEQTFLFVIAGFGILLLAGTMISVDIYVPLRKITRRISRYRAGCAPEHRRHAGKSQPSDREQFQRPADPDLPQSHGSRRSPPGPAVRQPGIREPRGIDPGVRLTASVRPAHSPLSDRRAAASSVPGVRSGRSGPLRRGDRAQRVHHPFPAGRAGAAGRFGPAFRAVPRPLVRGGDGGGGLCRPAPGLWEACGVL